MKLSDVRARYIAGQSRGKISDDSARDFIYMINQGLSVDTIIDLMDVNDNEGGGCIERNKKKLTSNPLIRQHELFCLLLGVRLIKPVNSGKNLKLIGVSEHKRMKECITELEVDGYRKTSKGYEKSRYEKNGFVAYVKHICSNRWQITMYEVECD